MIEMKTANEALERLEVLESLVQRIAATDIPVDEYLAIKRDARALLPEPVDPDLVEARKIMEARYYINDPEWQGDLDTTRAFKLLKRGRALERGEAK